MHVAVSIVGFRNAEDIAKCLEALSRSTHGDFEVVICENGGEEAYQALQQRIPDRLPGGQKVQAMLASGNLGYAGGLNLCFRKTPDADAWWVLNPDTKPEPDCLARLVERLKEGAGAVGATLYGPEGRVQAYGGRWRPLLARTESIGHGRSIDQPVDAARIERDQSFLNGASILLSRCFLEVVGPMREDFFLYCEEIEWCLRARRKGMHLGFAPEARILHDQGSTTGSGESIRSRPRLPIYLDERNKILITRQFYPALLVPAAMSAFAMLLLRYARRGAWRQLSYGISGWAAGLRNQRGVPDWVA